MKKLIVLGPAPSVRRLCRWPCSEPVSPPPTTTPARHTPTRSSALSDAKLTGVIATRVGNALPDDQCVVTRSQKAPWIKGDDFAPVTDTVLLYLNCNATVASATTPGNSAGSPEGRAALAAANAAAAPRPVDRCREPEPAQALVARHLAEQHVVASGAAGG